LNKTLHQPPAIQQGNHSIDGVFTQSGKVADRDSRENYRGLGVFRTEADFLTPVAGTPLAWRYAACIALWMFTMLTAPGLTLLFLGVVVGLGVAFVWMLWEVEQVSKPRRNSDRFG
jgi:hypothetical protein